MNTTTPPPRYETRAATDYLNILLHLPPTGQDWSLEASNAARLREFCDLYENGRLDAETKFALMCLIIASLEDLINGNATAEGTEETIQRVKRLLRQDFLLHLHTLDYWCLHDEADPENVFAPTVMLRRIWQDCWKPEYQQWIENSF